MTTQMQDKDYDLTGISDDGLFEPKGFGMRTWGECDECNRGYVATFAIVGQRLFLEELEINLEDDKPALHGAAASIGNDGFNTHYRNIQMSIEYSGGLLIATGFHEELNSHGGFH